MQSTQAVPRDRVAQRGFGLGVGSDRALWLGTAAVICLSLMLGGGTHQGLWSDAIVQLASLLLLGLLLLGAPASSIPSATATRGGDRRLVIALLPLLQLVRLPPMLWTLLPGRGAFAAAYREANISLPWLPISLDPAATWRSFLALAPPVAVFLATALLGFRTRRNLSL